MAGKRFKFGLENVLKLRRHEANLAQQDFASAAAERERQEHAVLEARQRLQDLAANAPGGRSLGPMVLRQLDAFRRDAQRACLQAERVLGEKQKQEDDARLRFVERRQAEEALEKLREEQSEHHVRTEAAQDLSFLDEQALAGFARKK